MKIKVGLIDDHQLFLKSLSLMLETLQQFEVVVEALSSADLETKMSKLAELPEVMLIDVNMPGVDGIETAEWLSKKYPAMRLVALSMNDKDEAIIKMFRAGCCAYLLKDTHPTELERALLQVHEKGYYNSEVGSLSMGRLLQKAEKEPSILLTAREQQFLQFACSELTYKQIAAEMNITERTVDGYREALFLKFQVQSRVGLCLEALRKQFVSL
jgi:DNA-binding NarL/FixJ family response regulator